MCSLIHLIASLGTRINFALRMGSFSLRILSPLKNKQFEPEAVKPALVIDAKWYFHFCRRQFYYLMTMLSVDVDNNNNNSFSCHCFCGCARYSALGYLVFVFLCQLYLFILMLFHCQVFLLMHSPLPTSPWMFLPDTAFGIDFVHAYFIHALKCRLC